jgi:hypothetical protein
LSIDSIFGELCNETYFIDEINEAFVRIENIGISETIKHAVSGEYL